jgi:hypothetical protein
MHKKPNMSCSIAIGQYYFIYATNKIVLSGLTLFTFFCIVAAIRTCYLCCNYCKNVVHVFHWQVTIIFIQDNVKLAVRNVWLLKSLQIPLIAVVIVEGANETDLQW